MKKIFAYLVLMAMTTLLVGGVVFFLFWLMTGAVAFAAGWYLPATIPSVWFTIRLSLVVGFIVSIFFTLSKEGSEVIDEFVKDRYKL